MPRNLVSEGYTHKCRVTVPAGKFTAAHTDFYLLLTEANFPASYFSTCGGYQHLVCGVATGDDTNVTELDREVFAFSAGGTQEIWLKIPSCPTASAYEIDVYIRASGGSEPQKTAGMWPTSAYALVSHDGITDSSQNAHTLTPGGTATTVAGQKPYPVLDFGSAGYVTLPSGLLGGLSPVVFQAWHYWPTVSGNDGSLCSWATGALQLLIRFSGATAQFYIHDGSQSGSAYSGIDRTATAWQRYSARYDTGGSMRMFRNSTKSSTNNSNNLPISTHSTTPRLGGDNGAYSSEYYGRGYAHGYRIVKLDLSDAFISDEYSAQSNPAAFYMVGSLQAIGGGPSGTTRRRIFLAA